MSESWKPDFPNWRDKFPDLIWWMELNEGKKVPRGTVDVRFKTIRDNTTGELWDMRIDHRGIPLGPVNQDPDGFKSPFGEKQTELKYDVWQYSLIVWCLQKIIFDGWIIRECYDVIKHFWRHLPGQPPLTVRSVNAWNRIHLGHKKEGILWP